MKSFINLFRYENIDEIDGKIYFSNVKLNKVFPDENFTVGEDVISIVIDPIESSVYIRKDLRNVKSKIVSIKEWLTSNGLCRTDTASFIFR